MTVEKKCALLNLIQFIDMAFKDKDINEQYREYKAEQIKSPAVRQHRTGKKIKNKSCI